MGDKKTFFVVLAWLFKVLYIHNRFRQNPTEVNGL